MYTKKDIVNEGTKENKYLLFVELSDGTLVEWRPFPMIDQSEISITKDSAPVWKGLLRDVPKDYSKIIQRLRQLKNGHGGHRLGAGRKTEGPKKKHISFYLTASEEKVMRYLLQRYRENDQRGLLDIAIEALQNT